MVGISISLEQFIEKGIKIHGIFMIILNLFISMIELLGLLFVIKNIKTVKNMVDFYKRQADHLEIMVVLNVDMVKIFLTQKLIG